jgi:hypothetical protein
LASALAASSIAGHEFARILFGRGQRFGRQHGRVVV